MLKEWCAEEMMRWEYADSKGCRSNPASGHPLGQGGHVRGPLDNEKTKAQAPA